MKKRYIFILSLILVILSMSCVSAGLFDGLFGGDDNKNITLINTTTDVGVIVMMMEPHLLYMRLKEYLIICQIM